MIIAFYAISISFIILTNQFLFYSAAILWESFVDECATMARALQIERNHPQRSTDQLFSKTSSHILISTHNTSDFKAV